MLGDTLAAGFLVAASTFARDFDKVAASARRVCLVQPLAQPEDVRWRTRADDDAHVNGG
jgi:hypothetical protein